MGDTFFNGLYPFIDISSGGTIDGVIACADRMLLLVDAGTKIIPGHGPLATKTDLKAFRDMLSSIRDRVKQLVKEGKTLKEVVDTKPSKDFDEAWGKGFLKPDTFVELVYKDLSRSAAPSKP